VGKPVAIFLDGTPISVPTVNEPIREGKAVITGRFDIKEAKQLVENLSAGALPVPITLLSQQTVGASLGKESLQKSLWAGVIGIIAVAIFMLLFYRLPGLMAVLALVVYILLNLAIFQIFNITLSLASIAGFILSIGMAVDANVLIFERTKEEIKAGRELNNAVIEGFKRAWTSIRDSNISSLITCLILYWIGSSVVKGFALTLFIGVVTSMFSAITVTRTLMKFIMGNWLKEKTWLFGVKKIIKN
jgi:preprotein translocase subunit SecD